MFRPDLPRANVPHPVFVWLWLGLVALGLSACATSPAPTVTASQSALHASLHDDTSAWKAVLLPGKRATHYQRVADQAGRPAWEAVSERSASMWRKTVYVAPADLGLVEFSWWASNLLPEADLAVGGQGDAPTRLIFAFDGDHSQLSLRNKMLFEMASTLSGETPPYATLMYVWANDVAPETVIINPRTDRIRKIVLDSGPDQLGRWRDHRRHLAEDFRRAFGEEPGPLVAVGLMTDTDNTQSQARSWYGDVRLPPPR